MLIFFVTAEGVLDAPRCDGEDYSSSPTMW